MFITNPYLIRFGSTSIEMLFTFFSSNCIIIIVTKYQCSCAGLATGGCQFAISTNRRLSLLNIFCCVNLMFSACNCKD